MLALPFRDLSSGFRLYKREALVALDLRSRDFDVLEAVVPAARRRGMQTHCWFEDVFCKDIPGIEKLQERDLYGRNAALKNFALLVNTTALGMENHPKLEISLHHAPATMAVADIVYAPLETKLLEAAAQRNLKTVEGLGMLLHQAVPGFTAWFGVTPVVDAELYRAVAA